MQCYIGWPWPLTAVLFLANPAPHSGAVNKTPFSTHPLTCLPTAHPASPHPAPLCPSDLTEPEPEPAGKPRATAHEKRDSVHSRAGGEESLRGVDHRRRRRGDLHRERAGLPLAQDISRHRGNDCESEGQADRQADTAVAVVVLTVESALGWGWSGAFLYLSGSSVSPCLYTGVAFFPLTGGTALVSPTRSRMRVSLLGEWCRRETGSINSQEGDPERRFCCRSCANYAGRKAAFAVTPPRLPAVSTPPFYIARSYHTPPAPPLRSSLFLPDSPRH